MNRNGGRGLRVALVAAAVLVASAGVSLATTRAVGDGGVIEACYIKKTGQLRLRTSVESVCQAGESPIAWNQKGPAGTFSGMFVSPNGAFSIAVTDAGIELKGPTGSAKIDGANVELRNAGSLVRLTPAVVQVTGTLVQLNGCGRGVARLGDQYSGGGGIGFSFGQIVTASTTVCTS